MGRTVVILLLYFDDSSHAYIQQHYSHFIGDWLYPIFIPTTKYLENYVYLEWIPQHKEELSDATFIGTLSWKFDSKIGIPPVVAFRKLCQFTEATFDVWAFFRVHQPMLIQAQRNHPHFPSLWTAMLTRMGFSAEQAQNHHIPFFACNYWMCKRDVMWAYCDFVKKAVHVLDTSHDLHATLHRDARHTKPRPNFKQATGLSAFPYHPFLLERLPCFYFHHTGAHVVYSIPPQMWNAAFDAEYYLRIHDDLKQEGLRTRKQAQMHFMQHGAYENRSFRATEPEPEWTETSACLPHKSVESSGTKTDPPSLPIHA